MKKELDDVFAKSSFAFSIFTIIYTFFEVHLVMIIGGMVFGTLGIVIGIMCKNKEFKNVGRVSIILSSVSIIISIVFLWMNFTN